MARHDRHEAPTCEGAIRICAALGVLDYGPNYTISDVARKRVFLKEHLTDRVGRGYARSYPAAVHDVAA